MNTPNPGQMPTTILHILSLYFMYQHEGPCAEFKELKLQASMQENGRAQFWPGNGTRGWTWSLLTRVRVRVSMQENGRRQFWPGTGTRGATLSLLTRVRVRVSMQENGRAQFWPGNGTRGGTWSLLMLMRGLTLFSTCGGAAIQGTDAHVLMIATT